MLTFLKNFFSTRGIDCFAPIPLSVCRIERPYLLARAGITDGTAILIAIPYYTAACEDKKRNISAYAVSRDYHGFFKGLFDELLPALCKAFPQYRFAGFADHSPIAEVEAAAKAGLGVIGKNHLLITKKYSSYIFLGELVTSAILPCKAGEILSCEACEVCLKACPMEKIGTCLSALTQKKGDLTKEEQDILCRYGSAWGCDICQEVCPHTKKAISSGSIFTPIPYFKESTISRLTTKILDELDEDAFSERAFAWRGRNTIRRNLSILEEQEGG